MILTSDCCTNMSRCIFLIFTIEYAGMFNYTHCVIFHFYYNEIVEEKDNFLFDDDQENDDQIPDPDEALKEAMAKLKVWKVSKFVIFGIAKYISSLR